MKIFCLYYDDKYSPEYVSKLYRGIKRNYSGDFEFICYTDNFNMEADTLIELPKDTPIKKHWHKLKFFDFNFGNQQAGEDIIVLDIDQVIVRPIDIIFDTPVVEKQLVSYEKWDRDLATIKLNGGFYKFKAGSLQCVYDKYISDPEYWQMYYFNTKIVTIPYYGEQNFVQDTVLENNYDIKLVSGIHVGFYMGHDTCDYNQRYNFFWNKEYIKRYKKPFMFIDNEWSEDIKIVHFAHLLNNIHQCEDLWLKKHWI